MVKGIKIMLEKLGRPELEFFFRIDRKLPIMPCLMKEQRHLVLIQHLPHITDSPMDLVKVYL